MPIKKKLQRKRISAENDRKHKYFFIIDEIIRGNMSKILGELLMTIDNNYRHKPVVLAYNGKDFVVPSNLYIIGMMNTADRSLAMIDYALRRRFSFVEMEPAFDSESFKEYQASLTSQAFDNIINLIIKLNADNMYQIFTYVKNFDKNNTGNVSGILLYAKTDETVLPDEKPFKIGGNTFSVKTLDLNTEFSEISNQLNEIIKFI